MINIFEVIENFDKICLYRHVNPDFDAYGSQIGLACIIKQLYPQKKVMLLGEKNEELLNKIGHSYCIDTFDEFNDALAIVLDTANQERIDGEHLKECQKIIKIDHHVVVDSYGDMNIEYPEKSSASQIVVELYQAFETEKMNEEAAGYLYLGIVGDSNRFMYRGTDASTLRCGAYLIECGIDIESIYQRMYAKKEKDLQINRFILNQYQSTNTGVAYYILRQEDLDALGISRSRGSDFVNVLANIEEFEVWMAITENSELNNWRVSIRSKRVIINEVAAEFGGGGHQLASGATLSTIEQLPELIKALEDEIKRL